MARGYFFDFMAEEMDKARSKHGAIHNLHEGSAVIREEFEEFWDEVKKRVPDREATLKELIQTATMCWRTAVDCGLIEE